MSKQEIAFQSKTDHPRTGQTDTRFALSLQGGPKMAQFFGSLNFIKY